MKRYTFNHIFSWILSLNFFRTLTPDSWFLFFRYKDHLGYYPNLYRPKTFSEKMQWLKLHNRNKEFSKMVDKYEVREFVANKLDSQILIPLVGGPWDSVSEINLDDLPNQFVLKCTHDSASVIICTDKQTFDWNKAKKKLQKSLKFDYYANGREWPYKFVKHRIIAEQFMKDNYSPEGLKDYKFYCFNGSPLYCQVIRGRFTTETIDFYDMEWKHMPFVGLSKNCANGETPVVRPSRLNDMIHICKELSCNLPFVRIDLYEINNKIYFGEITFFPAAGFGRFYPEEWNQKLGNLITLSTQSYE